MKQKTVRVLFSTFLMAMMFASNGQKVDYYEKYHKQYKGENSIVLKNLEIVEITNKKGEIQVETFTEQSTLILEDKPMPEKDERVQYNGFVPMSNLKAETLVPKEKGGYSSFKVKDFYDIDQLSSAIFYDDTRATSFTFEEIKKGSILKMSYNNSYKQPRFLSPFLFSNYVPIVESELIISYPNTVELKINKFNLEGRDIEEKKWTKGSTNYISYKSMNSKKFDYERDAPTAQYFMPHVSYFITSFVNDKKEKEEYLGGVKDLHGWYSGLLEFYDTAAISDELSGIVDSLFLEEEVEMEKVKKVFYWVQDHIKYIAFEDGMHGFIPRSGNSICSNRYGDCKDMASIINKMLQHAGVNSHLVWIGTRHIPYRYSEMPTPSVDNHMIAAYRFNDSIMFLDATASYLPFGMPNAFIQGKEALVNEKDGEFKVELVPVVKSKVNLRKDTTFLSYKDGNLIGKANTKLGGFRRMYLIMRTGFAKPDEKDKFYKELLSKANADCLVDDIKETNLLNKDTSIDFNYSLKINGYANVVENDLYINMNLEKKSLPSKIDSKRTVPVEFDFLKMDSITLYLDVPLEYTLNYLPENAAFDGKYFSYKIDYSKEDGKIKYTLYLEQKTMLLQPDEFEKYNDELSTLHNKFRESTIFKK